MGKKLRILLNNILESCNTSKNPFGVVAKILRLKSKFS